MLLNEWKSLIDHFFSKNEFSETQTTEWHWPGTSYQPGFKLSPVLHQKLPDHPWAMKPGHAKVNSRVAKVKLTQYTEIRLIN